MSVQLFVFAFLVALLFFRARPVRLNDAFLDKKTTSTVNGFFILMVFLSHFWQYCGGHYPNEVGLFFGQLMVTTFLFYSGYGCAAQYQAKGMEYLRTFFRKRILVTLINFDIAVLAFVLVGLLLGHTLTLRQVTLSLVCWDDVGNSNWYIFAILLCYSAFLLSFGLGHKTPALIKELVCTALVGLFVLMLFRVKSHIWYDTMMCFPAGVFFCLNRDRIQGLFKNFYFQFLGAFTLILIVAGLVAGHIRATRLIYGGVFNIKSISFALIVVMATMKIELRSPVLRWCGEYLFPIYIYQRIPMIVFSTLHPSAFSDWRCWIYCALSAVITIGIAVVYPRFAIRNPQTPQLGCHPNK